tara:strand:+ start:211 stop:390 length:180 start_codon:yes stop_codon:yes gene_type:complete
MAADNKCTEYGDSIMIKRLMYLSLFRKVKLTVPLPNVTRPKALGFKSDEIQHVLSVGEE